MKNILVTIGFDEHTSLLIDKAFELANRFNSKIWLMHIAPPDPADFLDDEIGPKYIRDIVAAELKEEHNQLQTHVDGLKQKGINAEGLLIQGATIEMILQESKKLAVDLIITGHQEHSFLYNAFRGNLSSKLINKSKIPILIVPYE